MRVKSDHHYKPTRSARQKDPTASTGLKCYEFVARAFNLLIVLATFGDMFPLFPANDWLRGFRMINRKMIQTLCLDP